MGKEYAAIDSTPKATKPKARDAKTKIAQNRMSVLELAKELGNVAEACRQRGMDRTSFYEWKRRFWV
ncbi:integrase, catalytic region [Rhodovulum sulfidophilum]|uniref:Integrase, catalytic region n=1 Tax=Rhodovulum sulfidophilum TaxID=35806 RepID=A0A0D6B6I0_RHOSU|nr:integrase, catalytic region [Rhodovulum sulfidophilum]